MTSTALLEWLGPSTTISDSGAPLLFYRGEGSGVIIDRFSLGLTRHHSFFFTRDYEVAKGYARSGLPEPYYLRLVKPLDLTSDTPAAVEFIREWARSWEDEGWVDRRCGEQVDPVDVVLGGQLFDYEGDWSMERWQDLQMSVQRAGYDGAHLVDANADGSVFVSTICFEPHQIKSASRNSGDYSRLTDDVRFSSAGARASLPTNWRRLSAASDEAGPLTLYHATNAQFDVLDPSRTPDRGLHFGGVNQALARARPTGRRLFCASLDVRNPARCRDTGGSWNAKIAHARANGHDSIVYLNRYEGVSLDSILRAERAGVDLDKLSDRQFLMHVPEAQDSYIVFDQASIKAVDLIPVGPRTLAPVQPPTAVSSQPAPSAPASTETALEAWFAASKVVDVHGNPLPVFHGSRSPWLTRFDLRQEGTGAVSSAGGRAYGALWFSDSRKCAQYFADRAPKRAAREVTTYGEGSRIYAAIWGKDQSQPLFCDGPFGSHEQAELRGAQQLDLYNRKLRQNTFVTSVYLRLENPLELHGVLPRAAEFARARAGGHDGIIAHDVVDGDVPSAVYVAFNPLQVKSATDNSGAYDRSSDDLRLSDAPAPLRRRVSP